MREFTVFGVLKFIAPKRMSVKNRGKKLSYFAWVYVDEQLSKGFGNNNYVTLNILSRDSSRGINTTEMEPGKELSRLSSTMKSLQHYVYHCVHPA